MYNLYCRTTMSSAHFIPNHCGKCKNLHGHEWVVIVNISSKKLAEDGMIIDFGKIKDIVKDLDHKCLNDFIKVPTAENLSEYIYEVLRDRILAREKDGFNFRDLIKMSVKIYESEHCSVEYTGEEEEQ